MGPSDGETGKEEALLMTTTPLTVTVDMSWAWIRQHPPHGGHCSQCATLLPYQCNVLQLSTKAGPKDGKGTTSESAPLCDPCRDMVDLAIVDFMNATPGASMPPIPMT